MSDLLKELPYWQTNDEWWYYDTTVFRCKLTDKAPPEAVASYNEYYKKVDAEFAELDRQKRLQRMRNNK